jgi:hypothetical protein
MINLSEFGIFKLVSCFSHAVELKDELYGHRNGVCSAAIANDELFTGSYDQTIRNWSIENIEERIKVRNYLKIQEEYSVKAEAYKSYLDSKKKKKSKKGKSASKGKSKK